MKIIETIRSWFKRKPAPPSPPPAPKRRIPEAQSVMLDTSTRLQMEEIGPDAFITNESSVDVMLEGTVIRRLFVPAGKTVRVVSPVLERAYDSATHKTRIQEWDAMTAAENMVREYARGRAYDELTPEECREVTFPIPDRMLGRILDRIKLTVHH